MSGYPKEVGTARIFASNGDCPRIRRDPCPGAGDPARSATAGARATGFSTILAPGTCAALPTEKAIPFLRRTHRIATGVVLVVAGVQDPVLGGIEPDDLADRPDAERFAHVAEQLHLGDGGPPEHPDVRVPSSSSRERVQHGHDTRKDVPVVDRDRPPLVLDIHSGDMGESGEEGVEGRRGPSPGGLRTDPRGGSDALREDATRARWRPPG